MQENNSIKRLQNIIQEYVEIIIVLAFATLLGFINGIVDTEMLGGTYYQNMFQPNLFQILERLLFIIVALFFGTLWHQLNKSRKENVRECHESELKYRTLAKTATDGIISIDENKRIIFLNKATETIFGYTQEEILGEDVKILMPEKYKQRHNARVKIYLETGKSKIIGKTVELEGLRKDGTTFPLELSLSVSDLESGCIFTAIIRDITERKKLELNLIDYTAQLEDLNQQRELFTDIMTHDLLNPVTIISNLAGMMLEDKPDDKTETELKMVKKNADRLSEMIETASKYAKLKSIDELEFKEKDLSVFIKDAIEHSKDFAKKKRIEIESNLDGSYPAKVNPFIEDVFLNLITNAIKFDPENSRIIVDIQDGGKDWRIGIKDFGEGIPDEYKKSIFHRFERIGKEGVTGVGLGLAIVKRIVDLHNGKVWVEDNPGGGSIFYVRVPKAG